jgi:hypothetical protein
MNSRRFLFLRGAVLLRPGLLAAALALATIAPLHAAWFKGNTHAHTINSDGDSSPDTVVRWYKEHGYQFVFVTDHDMITRVDGLNALFGSEKFLVLAGEEVTSVAPAPLQKVHVNALNPRTPIVPQIGPNVRATLQLDIDAVRAAGGLAQINHPNFFWMLKADDIAATRGATLLEISNLHPAHNNFGAGPDFPGTEEIWDRVLTKGTVVWGIASDDIHRLKTDGLSPADLAVEARPGDGWIVVQADKLGVTEIMTALERGRFYSSTGVTLKELNAGPAEISLEVAPEQKFPVRYVIAFIGAGGRVLQSTVDTKAAYRPKGDEGYVRVRVTDSNNHHAWTQPVMLK